MASKLTQRRLRTSFSVKGSENPPFLNFGSRLFINPSSSSSDTNQTKNVSNVGFVLSDENNGLPSKQDLENLADEISTTLGKLFAQNPTFGPHPLSWSPTTNAGFSSSCNNITANEGGLWDADATETFARTLAEGCQKWLDDVSYQRGMAAPCLLKRLWFEDESEDSANPIASVAASTPSRIVDPRRRRSWTKKLKEKTQKKVAELATLTDPNQQQQQQQQQRRSWYYPKESVGPDYRKKRQQLRKDRRQQLIKNFQAGLTDVSSTQQQQQPWGQFVVPGQCFGAACTAPWANIGPWATAWMPTNNVPQSMITETSGDPNAQNVLATRIEAGNAQRTKNANKKDLVPCAGAMRATVPQRAATTYSGGASTVNLMQTPYAQFPYETPMDPWTDNKCSASQEGNIFTKVLLQRPSVCLLSRYEGNQEVPGILTWESQIREGPEQWKSALWAWPPSMVSEGGQLDWSSTCGQKAGVMVSGLAPGGQSYLAVVSVVLRFKRTSAFGDRLFPITDIISPTLVIGNEVLASSGPDRVEANESFEWIWCGSFPVHPGDPDRPIYVSVGDRLSVFQDEAYIFDDSSRFEVRAYPL